MTDNTRATLPNNLVALFKALARRPGPSLEHATRDEPTSYEEEMEDAAVRLRLSQILGDQGVMKGNGLHAVQLLNQLRSRDVDPRSPVVQYLSDFLLKGNMPNLAHTALLSVFDAAVGRFDFSTAADSLMRVGATHFISNDRDKAMWAFETAGHYYRLANNNLMAAVAYHASAHHQSELEMLMRSLKDAKSTGSISRIITAAENVLSFFTDREEIARQVLDLGDYLVKLRSSIIENLKAYYLGVQDGNETLNKMVDVPPDSRQVDRGLERDLRQWGDRMILLLAHSGVMLEDDRSDMVQMEGNVDAALLRDYLSMDKKVTYFDVIEHLASRHGLLPSTTVSLLSSGQFPQLRISLLESGLPVQEVDLLCERLKEHAPPHLVARQRRLLEEVKGRGGR